MKKELDCLDYVILGICSVTVMILVAETIYSIIH